MKIVLSQEQLDATIAALEAAQFLFEQEAAALSLVPAGHALAEKRLKQAGDAAVLVDFYLAQ